LASKHTYPSKSSALASTDSADLPEPSPPPKPRKLPWLEHYVYVIPIKRFISKTTGSMYDKEQFTDMFGYHRCGKGKKSAAFLFLQGGGGQKFRRITFRPGADQSVTEDGELAFNVYRPPNVAPTHASVQPWLNLGTHVIPDEPARLHHLRWFAHLVQHPGAKINHGLLCISKAQGIGKDSWFAPIVRILGPLAGFITPMDLQDAFNDYLYQKLLLVVEELNDCGGGRRLPEKLKPLLARPPDTLRINRKGTPQFDVPNIVHGIFMSNDPQPLKIEASDRRFHVYQSQATPQSAECYLAYYQWLHDHLGAVYGFLQRYDLGTFNPSDAPPMTGAKETLIIASEPKLTQFTRSLMESLPILVTLTEFHKALPTRMQSVSLHALAECLKELGAEKLGKVRLRHGRPYLWALREVELCLDMGEGALKRLYDTQHEEWRRFLGGGDDEDGPQ
jgi:hypothetical protein